MMVVLNIWCGFWVKNIRMCVEILQCRSKDIVFLGKKIFLSR